MNKKLILRKSHRYIALIVGVQLLLGSIGGFYFSIIPIEEIRGNHLKAIPLKINWNDLPSIIPMSQVAVKIPRQNRILKIKNIDFVVNENRFFYKVVHGDNQTIWLNTITGRVLTQLT